MKPPMMTYEIPAYISGKLGFLAGQIKDPFETISRADFKKRRLWRRDYLSNLDADQMTDLTKQLKKSRLKDENDTFSSLVPRKKKFKDRTTDL